jgi:hypothetical protein
LSINSLLPPARFALRGALLYNGTMRHKMLSKDKEAMTGECQVCGPVKLKYVAHKNTYRCSVAVKAQEGVYTPGIGYQSKQERARLISSQSQKCGICGEHTTRLNRDHDHKTGKQRGFICAGCNLALGHAKDSANLLEAMAVYLRHHEAEETWFPQSVTVEVETAMTVG